MTKKQNGPRTPRSRAHVLEHVIRFLTGGNFRCVIFIVLSPDTYYINAAYILPLEISIVFRRFFGTPKFL